jgi:hypothetical protein
MSRWQRAALAVVVSGAVGFSLAWGIARGTDLAAAVLSAGVLVVALLTLFFVVPKPAELWLERQDELGLTDLIFYIYPQPAPADAPRVPRDFLLQLHVAVSNVGGRKAVLSALKLNKFVDQNGDAVQLPEVPLPLSAAQVDQKSGWVNHQRHSQLLLVLPPYVLEPDDVITLRFRCRRGIDWSQRWGLDELRAFADAISRDISAARVTLTFRRGASVEERNSTVSVRVAQQGEFRDLLRSLTADFTARPELPEQSISLE